MSAQRQMKVLVMLGVRPIVIIAGALLCATALVFAGSVPVVAKTPRFQTPSKKIFCLYSSREGPGPYIRCDTLFLNDVGFVLDRRHKARRIKVTDTVAHPRAPILHYGTSRRFGPFRCISRRSGLTCKSRRSGHGFTLSRERQSLF